MNGSLLEGYGITLQKLTEDKIELVRLWRNDPKISQYLVSRITITPEMQQSWFLKNNNDKNYYYIIVFRQREIGLIFVKDICLETQIGEGGVFIYDDSCLNTDIAYRAHLLLFDYLFDNSIIKEITSHVLVDNRRAIRFTSHLGFCLSPNQETLTNQEYRLSHEHYLSNSNRNRMFRKWHKNT
jgi:UDP-4-amino-4,6-dideoxy-N-acetyl-beta-L-altrosamine N-acetyltransferase